MKYFPAFLDLRGRVCRVFGDGELAAHKASSLLDSGAQVSIVARHPGPALRELAKRRSAELIERPFRAGDLAGVALAIDASEDENLHPVIAAEARAAGAWLNVVDRPSLCDYITPAVVRRGDLTIAVSTSGASPALASRIRQDLDRVYGDEYGKALEVLRAVRSRLMAAAAPLELRQNVFKKLAASPLCRYLRDGRVDEVDRLLADVVGPEVSLASLNVHLQVSEEP
ncbi:MAG TPA: bifunctional precorrin-2 dehydrogenase/sirohydrochlorin ferrochelatase [Terriglobales bacterium]|nr:bifunctional precorrin-2 dehydrogenase/sirohydrochlorin ferrochelatase [Terriglobales bacterium]